MLAVGLAVVGVFLAAANHPGELSAEYGMAAVVGVTAAISWWWHARYGVLPPLIRAMLMLAAPLAFILTAASVGFARDEVVLWQALGPLGPLLILVAVAKSPYRALLTTLPHWLTVVALAAVIAASDEPGATNAAYCTLVAGLIGLVAFGGWFYFHLTTEAIAVRAVEDQRALFWARTERLAQAAAAVARRRWRAMGLTACLALLRGLADGRLDPADPAVRAACADEEHYLRQLTQLDPDLVRMGQWFGRGLAEARSRGVELNVRTGAADLDDELADACGQLLLGVVGIVPAQHSMTSTLFGLESEMRFTILGPHPQASGVVESWEAPPGVEVSTRHFGAQDLIEVVATDVSRPYRRT